MARPIKQGLDYYPEDVDIYADDKIKFISALFEAEGEAIFHRLLAHIYRNGFYAAWGEDESLLFAMGLPWRRKSIKEFNETVANVVDELLKRDFFCKPLFDKYKILTSTGIQKRYVTGTEKRSRIEIDERYWLLKKESPYLRDSMYFYNVNFPENGVSSPDNEVKGGRSTQSKVEESKVNKSKVNDTTVEHSPEVVLQNQQQQNNEKTIIQYFTNNIHAMPPPLIIEKLLSWTDIFPADVIVKAIEEAVSANKRSFKYIEGILKAWEKEKLLTLSMVERHLKNWNDKKNSDASIKPNQPRQNKFNFKQREWDYEQIERLEREYINESLMENDKDKPK